MNILVIYPYIPYPLDRGTYQRTFHLLRELAREHAVDLIALSENGERLDQPLSLGGEPSERRGRALGALDEHRCLACG